jgi:hypothetical protein
MGWTEYELCWPYRGWPRSGLTITRAGHGLEWPLAGLALVSSGHGLGLQRAGLAIGWIVLQLGSPLADLLLTLLAMGCIGQSQGSLCAGLPMSLAWMGCPFVGLYLGCVRNGLVRPGHRVG